MFDYDMNFFDYLSGHVTRKLVQGNWYGRLASEEMPLGTVWGMTGEAGLSLLDWSW